MSTRTQCQHASTIDYDKIITFIPVLHLSTSSKPSTHIIIFFSSGLHQNRTHLPNDFNIYTYDLNPITYPFQNAIFIGTLLSLHIQILISNPQALSQWLMDQPPLGHKDPRPNIARLDFCPACRDILPTPVPLTSRHNLNFFHIPYHIAGMSLKNA